MTEAAYTVTLVGPDGYVQIDAENATDAASIAEHLLEATNEYHEVQIESA